MSREDVEPLEKNRSCLYNNVNLDFQFNLSPAVDSEYKAPNYNCLFLKNGSRVNSDVEGSNVYLEMDFRSLVESATIPSTDYVTHAIHKHPAIFIPQIPRHIIESYTDEENEDGNPPIVLDPFNGSGTTGLEAKLLGRDYVGIEINPLSKLISEVSTTPIPPTCIKDSKQEFCEHLLSVEPSEEYDVEFLDNTNKEHWFQPEAIEGLTQIRHAIDTFDFSTFNPNTEEERKKLNQSNIANADLGKSVKKLYVLMLANTVFDVSNADPGVSKAHKSPDMREKIKEDNHPPEVIPTYLDHLDLAEKKFIELWNRVHDEQIPGGTYSDSLSYWQESTESNHRPEAEIDIRLGDARSFDIPEYKESADLAITSPPYINAMNYYRGTKLRLFWIHDLLEDDLSVEQLRRNIVGTNSIFLEDAREEYDLPMSMKEIWNGEHTKFKNTSLPELDNTIKTIHESSLSDAERYAYVTWKFFSKDMLQSLTRVYEHLKPGAHFFFLIGENTVGGERVQSHRYVADVAQNLGQFDGHQGDLHKNDGYDLIGFAWDEITNRDLFQGRNHTNGVIEGEWVVILQKPR